MARDALQRPLAGVHLRLEAPDGRVVGTVSSGPSGAYRFTGVAPGVYSVVAEQEGFETATAVVSVEARGGANADLTLASKQALDLSVVAKQLEAARTSIQPRIGATTYSIPAQAIQTQPGANYYLLRGLEILPVNSSAAVDTLVMLGDGATNQSAGIPSNIEIDQCYIHGWDGQSIKRGVALNDTGSTGQNGVLSSYISNIKALGQDSQAIAGWNGPGPFTITNNYLEAASENFLLGGSDPAIQNLIPSDIIFTKNHLTKPLAWMSRSMRSMMYHSSASSVPSAGRSFGCVAGS